MLLLFVNLYVFFCYLFRTNNKPDSFVRSFFLSFFCLFIFLPDCWWLCLGVCWWDEWVVDDSAIYIFFAKKKTKTKNTHLTCGSLVSLPHPIPITIPCLSKTLWKKNSTSLSVVVMYKTDHIPRDCLGTTYDDGGHNFWPNDNNNLEEDEFILVTAPPFDFVVDFSQTVLLFRPSSFRWRKTRSWTTSLVWCCRCSWG